MLFTTRMMTRLVSSLAPFWTTQATLTVGATNTELAPWTFSWARAKELAASIPSPSKRKAAHRIMSCARLAAGDLSLGTARSLLWREQGGRRTGGSASRPAPVFHLDQRRTRICRQDRYTK